MKKILSVLLALIFCFGLCPASAFAANGKIVVEAAPSTTTASIGDTFTVDFNLTTNAGLYTLGLEVSYDKSVLEVVCPNHKEGSSCISSRSPVTNKLKVSTNSATDSQYHYVVPYKIMWGFSSIEVDMTRLGRIATLTFKVKQNAPLGKTKITLEVDQSSSLKTGAYKNSERVGVSAEVNIKECDHKYGEWAEQKAPGCTETGTEARSCSHCGATDQRDIKATGHTLGKWEQTTAPTCTADGTETVKCTASGCTYIETKNIPATGHNFSEWATTKSATCEAKGEQTRTCQKCKLTEKKVLESLQHKFEKPIVTKKPTCTETGIEEGKCTLCNKQAKNILQPLGHKMEKYTVTLEPTCTAEGKKQGVCSVCGEKAEEKIPAKGHTFGKAVITKNATATETGLKTVTCTVCGQTAEEVIPCIIEPTSSKEAVESEASDGEDTKDALLNQSEGISVEALLIILAVSVVALAVSVIAVFIKRK